MTEARTYSEQSIAEFKVNNEKTSRGEWTKRFKDSLEIYDSVTNRCVFFAVISRLTEDTPLGHMTLAMEMADIMSMVVLPDGEKTREELNEEEVADKLGMTKDRVAAIADLLTDGRLITHKKKEKNGKGAK